MKRVIWILVGTLLLSLLAQPAFAAAESVRTAEQGNNRADASAQNQRLTPAAQAAISAAIGRDQSAYHAKALPRGFRLQSPRADLRATFKRQGVRIGTAAQAGWGLAFEAYGTGENLQKIEAAEPQARDNRVEYRRGPVTEWYVNGPAGLEQGFTIAKAPASGKNGMLTLALAMSGNLRATVEASGTGLALSNGQRLTLLRYGGLTAFDAGGRQLPSWLEVRRAQLLLRVDTTGALFPVTVDPWVYVARLTASDSQASDQLGRSVSLSADGSTVVFGAPGAQVSGNEAQGAAYVFVRPSGGWTTTSNFSAKLVASDGAPYDELGYSVSVSADGSTVVLGAPLAETSSTTGQGAGYVFSRPAAGWVNATETAKLVASEGAESDAMGWSVWISADGSTVVAGAPWAQVDSVLQGAAYVFVRPSSGWGNMTQSAKLAASDGAAEDHFGWSVSASSDGSTVVTGAPGARVGSNPLQGAAYVFVRPSGGWTTTSNFSARLTGAGGMVSDNFGSSVSTSADGSTVVAGASSARVGSNYGQGAAYVFVRPSGGWTTTSNFAARLTASDGMELDLFGSSVSTSADGSTVVAGAPEARVGSNDLQGAAYVFAKSPSGWATTSDFAAKLTSPNPQENAYFGSSVGVSADGLTAAVGVVHETGPEGLRGAVYIFSGASQFEVHRLNVSAGPHATFEMGANFVLAATSNGIDPVTEPVTLVIGSKVLAIPARSFVLRGSGNYIFAGVVDDMRVAAEIRYLGAYAYAFHLVASGADLSGLTNPVTVTLSIGDDSGTAQVNAQIH